VGDFSYRFVVFDFSHEEVKRAVVGIKVLFTLYLTMHASSCTLTMNTSYKKEKEKKKKKTDQEIGPRTISPPPPAIEISTPREIIVTFPHPPLFSHDGYYLGVDVKPSSFLLCGLGLTSLGFLFLFIVDTPS